MLALRRATVCSAAFATALRHQSNDGKKWSWGAAELNRLSFIDEAKDAKVNGPPVNVRDFAESVHWELEDVANNVQITHKPMKGLTDHIAYRAVRLCRFLFDTISGYSFGKITEKKVVNRCLFLETIAAVPGMVGGMLRHLRSLRRMESDHGWIQTLLTEAENERMHLMTFMDIRQPGLVFRTVVILAQAVMFNLLFLLYAVWPKFVHRFVGYLEEEAVITYTSILKYLDEGELAGIRNIVPDVAKVYWNLPSNATFHNMIAAIRADEAEHRVVNHTFADMHAQKLQYSVNPFAFIKGQPDATYKRD